jgi:hypothetical protein
MVRFCLEASQELGQRSPLSRRQHMGQIGNPTIQRWNRRVVAGRRDGCCDHSHELKNNAATSRVTWLLKYLSHLRIAKECLIAIPAIKEVARILMYDNVLYHTLELPKEKRFQGLRELSAAS